MTALRTRADPPDAAARCEDARVSDPTDVELLTLPPRSAQAGFAQVMRRHSGVVYAVAFRRLGSTAEAEEAAQDAFVLLWRKRHRLALAGDSALPWLIVTVQHLARNRLRGSARRLRHESAAIAAAPVATADDTEAGAVRDLLERAFAALAPLDARIARLCLGEDLTYAEAAAQVGLTEGAVRNRLSRARARLRGELADEREETR